MEKNLCISPEINVREAISALVDGGKKSVFVVGSGGELAGLFTNGDMRRYLLTGRPLSEPITQAMNPAPAVFRSYEEALESKAAGKYIVYPIISGDGKLIDALFQENGGENKSISSGLENVPLVIMAGGKGTRLYPYTKILPKAIIPIGQYSITERIIRSFYKYGCRKVYMILNHKASLIKAYMSEADTGCDIHFIQEEKDSGTAGGLRLLRNEIKSTFILSNCDIIINDDLECAYKTHVANGNQITYICAMKNHTIPYGVINASENGTIGSITEKPLYSFLASTGVYVIEPSVLDEIEEGEFIHITDLTERCMSKGMRAGVFPISEKSWMDMGQIEEMEHMIRQIESEK